MNARLTFTTLLAVALAHATLGAGDSAKAPETKPEKAPPPAPAQPAQEKAGEEKKPAGPPPVAQEAPTVMPGVEVRKSRVTELDRQLAQQEKEIAREKKNTRPTELDKALNDSKVSKALSIFGGESSDHRATIARERVALMQEEKVLMETIAQTKSKEDKQALQKELDQLKALRRDLEKSLR